MLVYRGGIERQLSHLSGTMRSMSRQDTTLVENPEGPDESAAAHLGLRPDYPYLDDFLATGRLRNPATGRFVTPCPSYPEHPAPCHESIGSHYGWLWPAYGTPFETAMAFFAAADKPWADTRSRKMVFHIVEGVYFGGFPPAGESGGWR